MKRMEWIVSIADEGEIGVVESAKWMQELVRCRDCKHYRYYGLSRETVSECTIDHCENPDADWFCADGEREDT